MTEKSFLWQTGAAGDGSTTYTTSDWSEIVRIMGAAQGSEGVVPGYLNKLNASTSLNTVNVQSGAAIVDGKPYVSDATVPINIPSPVGGGNTRIDRIVLRANWSAQTVRLVRIAGTDAASPVAPSISNTSESEYDLLLYQALVLGSGSVSLTDERVFATADINTFNLTYEEGQLRVADEGIGQLQIQNWTKRLFVPAVSAYDDTNSLTTVLRNQIGWACLQNVRTLCYGTVKVPIDYLSGGAFAISALTYATAGGYQYSGPTVYWGAEGQVYNTDSEDTVGTYEIGALFNQWQETGQINIDGQVLTNDILSLVFERDGLHANDTSAGTIYFAGWIIEYESYR